MKQIYCAILLLLILSGCKQRLKPVSTPSVQTTIRFENTDHDFGQYAERESKRCSFVFSNTGRKPLFISSVETDCGCTTVVFPKHPVAPNEKDSLVVTYDGNGFIPGAYRKWITVQTNGADSAVMLMIYGRYAPND